MLNINTCKVSNTYPVHSRGGDTSWKYAIETKETHNSNFPPARILSFKMRRLELGFFQRSVQAIDVYITVTRHLLQCFVPVWSLIHLSGGKARHVTINPSHCKARMCGAWKYTHSVGTEFHWNQWRSWGTYAWQGFCDIPEQRVTNIK